MTESLGVGISVEFDKVEVVSTREGVFEDDSSTSRVSNPSVDDLVTS